MYKIIIALLAALLLIGCQQTKSPKQANIQKTNSATLKQQAKVSQAFKDAPTLDMKNSKWFDRTEKLPLTIITTAYIDNEVIKTKEYKIYRQLIKKIEKDITILDKLSGKNISSKYSSIKFIDYDKSKYTKAKFHAAYTNRYKDKSTLSDVLRPDIEKSSQELLIRLNYEELKKGNLTIEGYKTVKETNKPRNSYYYSLVKENYSKLSDKQQKQAIANSILATLQLSIPEYVSIDRKELIKKDELLRFITPQEDGTYKGEVWKYHTDNLTTSIENKIYGIIKNSSSKDNSKVLTFPDNYDHVNSLDISDDRKYALTGGVKTVKYWNLETGKIIKKLDGHKGFVWSVDISKDGRYAISGGMNSVIYWDLKTGSTVKVLKYDPDPTAPGSVNSVNISDDGKYVLLAGNRTIEYWDLKKGKLLRVLKGHPAHVSSVAISKNGKYAISGSEDRTLKYWNLQTGELIKTLKGHEKYITSVDISKDGNYVVSGSADKTIRYWNLENGKTIKILKGHKGNVNTVSLSNDSKYILSGSADKTTRYWDIKLGKSIDILKGQKGNITSVKISQDGNYAISGDFDGTMQYSKLIDGKSREKVYKLYKQIQTINDLNKNREDETLQKILTTAFRKTDLNILHNTSYIDIKNKLNLSDISSISKVLNYQYDDPILNKIFVNSYNKYTNLALQTFGNTILTKKRVDYNLNELYFSSNFDLKNKQYTKVKEMKNLNLNFEKSKVLEGHSKMINSVDISPDGKYALSGSGEKTIRYWDLATGKTINTLVGHEHRVDTVVFSPDGKHALSGSLDGTFKYWDLKTGKVINTIPISSFSMTMSPDGKHALSGSHLTHDYFDLTTGKVITTLKGHTNFVNSVAISKDGKYALTGSNDKTISYWDLETGEIIKVLKGHTGYVKSVAISEDGNYAISGSADKTMRYWDLRTGKTIKVLIGDGSEVWAVDFTNNGNNAVSGSIHNNLTYWNLKTGEIIKVLKGHSSFVTTLVISKDSQYVLSGSYDKTLRYWNLSMFDMNANY